ncbi:hypothetical protein HYZ41_01150 [archaeon]|nr:hypothetical protein [archaeon]
MPEENVIVVIIVMFIVLAIVVATFGMSNPFKTVYGTFSQTREMITITRVSADPVAYDAGNGKYTIATALLFHVDPDPDDKSDTVNRGIIPLISFKNSYAKSETIFLTSGEDDYDKPSVKFEIVSSSPPIENPKTMTGAEFPPIEEYDKWIHNERKIERDHTYLFEDGDENRYLISLSELEIKGNILGFSKTCRARFRMECKNDLKQSEEVEGCNIDEKECTDTTVFRNCNDGTVTIKANSLYCIAGYADVTVTTKDGMKWSDMGETAVVSLFRNSDCVNTELQRALANGIKILNENCPNDFLASKKITLKIS